MDDRQRGILESILENLEWIDYEITRPTDSDIDRLALVFSDWGPKIVFPSPCLEIAKWSGFHWMSHDEPGSWLGPIKNVVAYAWV